ncbi:MAG: MauE/DoxX family redox-associated membrane protein [Ginsengibacter sp.]
MLKKISLLLFILLYVGAGINHFWHPAFYYSIIPSYLPDPYLLNIAAGTSEIVLGILLIFSSTRKAAAYLIIAMLIVFISVHVYMIQKGGCMNEIVCIPLWEAWLRLALQPVLILWAWWHRK